jgi:NodT family efflux transporter outer membrane factor (OMF) lipoprotein
MKKIIIVLIGALLMSSCSIYKTFETPEIEMENLYRNEFADSAIFSDSKDLGELSWREMFTDTLLQGLIEKGLEANVDLQTAMLRVEQAQASLTSARLAYTPSLSFSASGTMSHKDESMTKWYEMPLTSSWQVPLFGGLRNAKRSAKSTLEQQVAYKQAVQTQVIATIANNYYYLQMLDRQLVITKKTIDSWGESVEIMRELKGVGMTNEASITQSEANYYALKTSYTDLKRLVREIENTLSLVLGQTPQVIERSGWSPVKLPQRISTGVPVQLLANRPDIKEAEMALATAFYVTNVARSAFYPNITINASVGWTNYLGGVVSNPGELISSVIGSITAPVFSKGKNKAALKIAQTDQKIALLNFKQSVLIASSEVSDALFQYTTAIEKQQNRGKQLEALEKSEKFTKELFTRSSSTYLEVLTAQQGLLSAQLSETNDWFEQVQSIIDLYQALGGGREK